MNRKMSVANQNKSNHLLETSKAKVQFIGKCSAANSIIATQTVSIGILIVACRAVAFRILGKRINFCSIPITRRMLPTFVQACLALGPIPLQLLTDFEGGHINFLLWLTLSMRNAIIAMLTPPRKIKTGMIKLSSDNGTSLISVGIVQDTGSLAWISLSIFAWIPQAISHEIAMRSSSCNETNQKNI